jgi:hypothetical protein
VRSTSSVGKDRKGREGVMGFMCTLSLPAPTQTPRALVARNQPILVLCGVGAAFFVS